MPRGVDRYDEARQQGRLWTPTALPASELKLWVDVDDRGTITASSDLVSQLNDKSGNGSNLTEATNKPLLQMEPQTGKFGLYLGNGAVAKFLSGTWSISTTTFYAACACTMETGTVNNGRLFSIGTTGSTNDYDVASKMAVLTRNGTGNTLRATRASASFGGPASVTLSRPFIQGMALDGSNGIYYINGTAGTSGASTGTLSTANIRIGKSIDFTEYWRGYLFELVATVSVPSIQLRTRIDGYLAWKWGTVKDLAAAHPFKNRPPLMGD
ncbi:MAG: hypothetical protein H0T60_18650 [Acidobacteria bacterium]|nr:hypothetical protein [Acidobacteriota bacterium]